MNEAKIGFDLSEEEILIYEVSDEALEATAYAGQENMEANAGSIAPGHDAKAVVLDFVNPI